MTPASGLVEALTGQQATIGQGTLTPVADGVVALVGQSMTVGQGSMTTGAGISAVDAVGEYAGIYIDIVGEMN